MTKINVLSLFNGCGMLRPALDKAGITIDSYYSSEIDKFANHIANKNYPDTQQLGDINDWQEWQLPQIDLLTAGFPCQDLSCAGKGLGLNGERSSLLFQALTIRDRLKPKYFLFENVASMKQQHKEQISELIGIEPIRLNSKYFGVQNRDRLFWTNIPNALAIENNQISNDPHKKFSEILLDGVTDREKAKCLLTSYSSVTNTTNQLKRYLNGRMGQIIFTNISQLELDQLFAEYGKKWSDELINNTTIRKLYPVECERLMNLPDNYTEGVSKTQRYKMLGNGWDVDVVAEILSNIIT